MKMSPELRHAESNMQPGTITASGFLGDDRRPLVDIIQKDEEIFRALALDFDEAARSLHDFTEQGKAGLGEPISIGDEYRVQIFEARGFLACPWEDGIFRKINTQLIHVPTGNTILYSELSLHMMEVHHFLEGEGSPFRLIPEKLREIIFPYEK
jgi:hypothetical protein